MAAISDINSAAPILFTSARYAQKYSAKTIMATSIIASQMRRCQKRFSDNGFMIGPLFKKESFFLCFHYAKLAKHTQGGYLIQSLFKRIVQFVHNSYFF